MKRLFINLSIFLVSVVLTIQFLKPVNSLPLDPPVMAPEFTHSSAEEWLNSEPLNVSDLKGKVILLDFWTFDCWNCYRSFPWLNALEKRLKPEGLQIIGVHTPEFEHEKIRKNIANKALEFELHHPIMIDSDFSYWKAMENRYWPAYYLIDKKGKVRATFVGETHEGDRQAKIIEKTIQDLIAED